MAHTHTEREREDQLREKTRRQNRSGGRQGQVLHDAGARGILRPVDVSGWRDRQGVGSSEALGIALMGV